LLISVTVLHQVCLDSSGSILSSHLFFALSNSVSKRLYSFSAFLDALSKPHHFQNHSLKNFHASSHQSKIQEKSGNIINNVGKSVNLLTISSTCLVTQL